MQPLDDWRGRTDARGLRAARDLARRRRRRRRRRRPGAREGLARAGRDRRGLERFVTDEDGPGAARAAAPARGGPVPLARRAGPLRGHAAPSCSRRNGTTARCDAARGRPGRASGRSRAGSRRPARRRTRAGARRTRRRGTGRLAPQTTSAGLCSAAIAGAQLAPPSRPGRASRGRASAPSGACRGRSRRTSCRRTRAGSPLRVGRLHRAPPGRSAGSRPATARRARACASVWPASASV